MKLSTRNQFLILLNDNLNLNLKLNMALQNSRKIIHRHLGKSGIPRNASAIPEMLGVSTIALEIPKIVFSHN